MPSVTPTTHPTSRKSTLYTSGGVGPGGGDGGDSSDIVPTPSPTTWFSNRRSTRGIRASGVGADGGWGGNINGGGGVSLTNRPVISANTFDPPVVNVVSNIEKISTIRVSTAPNVDAHTLGQVCVHAKNIKYLDVYLMSICKQLFMKDCILFI